MTDDFAVLVLSCDKYADLWPPFFQQYRKYFPPEDWPVYLGSNLIACHEEGVIPVLSGPDRDWSTSYKLILGQIKQKKLFVILEDLLLSSPVDPKQFEMAVNFLFSQDARHIKYWPNPLPDRVMENASIGVYERGAPYRATVCGFWDRDYLMSLLIDGENPWDFEILGSYRTAYSDGFYCLTTPLCSYKNMIEKRMWIPQSIVWARAEGVVLDLDRRPLLKGGKDIVSRAKMAYFYLMMHIPWRWRVALMNKLRRALISY